IACGRDGANLVKRAPVRYAGAWLQPIRRRRAFMPQYIQVLTATSTKEDATAIAQALVELRLAACVQIGGPITSFYRWEGQITTGEEWHLTAKTKASLYSEVENAIRHLHKYDVPEIVALPIEQGHAPYLEWME